MRNNRLKERGITLIALVITIIVLLLLAGISISMLAGNNSVLNRAGQSRAANALGIAKDQVNLAVMAAVQDYYQSIYDGQNVSTTYTASNLDNYIVTNVKKNNTENNEYNLEVTDVEFGNWKNKKITLKYLPDGSIVKGTLNNGVMTWGNIENAGQDPTLSEGLDATAIAAAPTTYFGMDVVGYTTNERVKATTSAQDTANPDECKTIEWQVFYAGKIDDTDTTENNHIYLISKDYVENSYLPGKTISGTTYSPLKISGSNYKVRMASTTTNGIMNAYGGSSSITNSTMKKLNKDYSITKNYNSSNPNMKAVAYMLDKDIWNSRYGNNNYSDYVIGGPSVELLFKSYNKFANGGNNVFQARAKSTYGYEISKNSGANWDNSYSGFNAAPYCISSGSKANAYWMASPSAIGVADVMALREVGYVDGTGYPHDAYGIRPLICLKDTVELQETTIGGKTVLQIVE